MSYLPLLPYRHLNPYEKQVSSVKKTQRGSYQPRSKKSKAVHLKLQAVQPSQPIIRREEDDNGDENTVDSRYKDMTFMQRMHLAIDAFEIKRNTARSPPSIRTLANTFGLDWKILKRHIEFMERDNIFFENFSIEFYVEEIENIFRYRPLRYFLITGAPEESCAPWGMTSFGDDLNLSESGALSKQFIIDQCRQWICNLESNCFVSLTNANTKKKILKKASDFPLDVSVLTPRNSYWNCDTLKLLCSIYVSLHEKDLPPSVLFSRIMKNKKANVYNCPFAFVLFDKYLLIHFPNYFHLMLSTMSESAKVGKLMYNYSEIYNKLFSKLVNLIRINELTSPIKKSYECLEKEVTKAMLRPSVPHN